MMLVRMLVLAPAQMFRGWVCALGSNWTSVGWSLHPSPAGCREGWTRKEGAAPWHKGAEGHMELTHFPTGEAKGERLKTWQWVREGYFCHHWCCKKPANLAVFLLLFFFLQWGDEGSIGTDRERVSKGGVIDRREETSQTGAKGLGLHQPWSVLTTK